MRILDAQSTEGILDLLVSQQNGAKTGKLPKILVIAKGDSAEICGFVSQLRDIVESVEWREVIWVRDEEKLSRRAESLLFRRSGGACAVVLGSGLEPNAFLSCGCSRYEIEIALLDAMKASGSRES